MKRIVIYSVLFLFGIYGIRYFLYVGLRKNTQGIYYKYNTLFIKHNTYNTLLLGSSRIQSHIVTSLFDSITGLNSYNAGIEGATPHVAYTVLKAYCENSDMPKRIVLELDPHRSHVNADTIYLFPRFFPYLQNQSLYKGLKEIDPRFSLFKYNAIYALTFMGSKSVSSSLHGWLNIVGKYDTLFSKGYLKYINELPDKTLPPYNGFVGVEYRQYLDSIITFSEKNHIQLCFTISPMSKNHRGEFLNKEEVIKQLKTIALMHHVPLLDFTNDSLCNNRIYFKDNYHLLHSGAIDYTRKFSEAYRNIMQK